LQRVFTRGAGVSDAVPAGARASCRRLAEEATYSDGARVTAKIAMRACRFGKRGSQAAFSNELR
jgi:hypothetical protein